MHDSTPELARQVRDASTIDDQIDLLANRYAGEPCVIVTCGPSLAQVPPAEFRRSLAGVLTIVVKQAIDVVRGEADFQCWNSFNVRRFEIPSANTIRCFVAEPTGRMIQHNRADIRFALESADGDLSRSIAAKHDFGDYLLDDDGPRPFGPGIMYELCFYLAVHLGVSEILTVGWDIADSDGKNTHFDDQHVEQQFFESVRDSVRTEAATKPHPLLSEGFRRPVRWARTRRRHQSDEVYNRTRVLHGETPLVAASTGPLAAWLSELGLELVVGTDSPHLDSSIPRIAVNEVIDHIERWSR